MVLLQLPHVQVGFIEFVQQSFLAFARLPCLLVQFLISILLIFQKSLSVIEILFEIIHLHFLGSDGLVFLYKLSLAIDNCG